MARKLSAWVLTGISLMVLSGCATGRSYQSDIDSMNARISSLQRELSQKDSEIARLQNQAVQQQAALSQAESEKRILNDKLDMALAQLRSQSKPAPAPSEPPQGLK